METSFRRTIYYIMYGKRYVLQTHDFQIKSFEYARISLKQP